MSYANYAPVVLALIFAIVVTIADDAVWVFRDFYHLFVLFVIIALFFFRSVMDFYLIDTIHPRAWSVPHFSFSFFSVFIFLPIPI